MVVLSYEDIIAKAEEFIKFGKDIHFLVKGYLAEDIVFYLDGSYTQYMECGHEDEYIINEYYNNKMYWVDIAPKEGLYYVQEAVYEPQGILAQNDEYDIVYYQKNNILSKENENRILGNIFEFTYDEDVEDEYDTEDEYEAINEEYYELNDSLKGDWTVETLEDCDCNKARIALSTAITMTPTSAKMANHIFAIPSAPRIKQITLIPMANTMF